MKQTIEFKYKNKIYTFSRPYTPEMSFSSWKWIRDCYASIGAKSEEITCKRIIHTGWSSWATYVD